MKIGIVGLGYVGLPLAAAFGRAGHEVIGYDVDTARVERLNRGESDIEDVPSAELSDLGERFAASADPAVLGGCDAVLICVPTPLVSEREPDLTYVRESADTIAAVLREGQLIVLESTTYPGRPARSCCRGSSAAASRSGAGSSSPTRRSGSIRAAATTRSRPRRRSSAASPPPASSGPSGSMREVCDEVVPVSSPEAAELSKLLENIFRSVNIALVNELAQLTDRLGIDIWEVVDAAASKPFGFMRFEPGPGMGGHCLPVDPFYLAYKAREHDFATEFVELAGKINQSHPLFCVSKIQRALNEREKAVKGSKVLIVGVAYKSGVADLRESPALKIIDHLRELGADVSYHDPHVPALPGKGLESVPLDAAVAAADAVAIVTAHPGLDYPALVAAAALVIDFRGVTRELAADNVVLL